MTSKSLCYKASRGLGPPTSYSNLSSFTRLRNLTRAGSRAEAAKDADALLLAVRWSRIKDVLSQAGDLSGKVIVSCSLPMNANNTGLVIAGTWSGAEELAKMFPMTLVVSAFNTVPSKVLFRVFEDRRKAKRPSLANCGDEKKSKAVAAKLTRDAGFDPVDVGPLRIARYTEPFALLVAQLAMAEQGAQNWLTDLNDLGNKVILHENFN